MRMQADGEPGRYGLDTQARYSEIFEIFQKADENFSAQKQNLENRKRELILSAENQLSETQKGLIEDRNRQLDRVFAEEEAMLRLADEVKVRVSDRILEVSRRLDCVNLGHLLRIDERQRGRQRRDPRGPYNITSLVSNTNRITNEILSLIPEYEKWFRIKTKIASIVEIILGLAMFVIFFIVLLVLLSLTC